MLNRLLPVLPFLAVAALPVAAQEPVPVALPEVPVVAERLRGFSAGAQVDVLDSTRMERYRGRDLGELLKAESGIFVKSYGLGSLATTSFRGGSANHTAVLWNGFSISSPMNGQLDLSLIPTFAGDRVAVQYGGGSALWGSGAVGGTILLGGTAPFDRPLDLEVGAQFGSFGDFRQQARVRWGRGRWASSIAFTNTRARNDFSYHPLPKSDHTQRQTNAELEQRGLLIGQHFRWGKGNQVDVNGWLQHSDRRIPPLISQAASTARQVDDAFRYTATWRRVRERYTTSVRAAWFDERLDWYAFADLPAAPSRARTAITEAEVHWKPAPKHLVHVGINGTFARATADGYPHRPAQDRSALFGAYRFRTWQERWRTSFTLRQEMLDGQAVPITGGIGSELDLPFGFMLKAAVNKVYRIPTFNDRFWQPGGNPDLRPEDGWGQEGGLVWNGKFGKRLSARTEITAFHRLMSDWIIWLPGPAYWSPKNVAEVRSRGVESRTRIGLELGKHRFDLLIGTDYVVSTSEGARTANDASVGKQLIYVPMYSGRARLGWEYKAFSADLHVQYTGYRYTSTDNSAFLEPYWLTDIRVAYRMAPTRLGSLLLSGYCDNLFDTRYTIMLSRPMPLRNYRVGLTLLLATKPSKTQK